MPEMLVFRFYQGDIDVGRYTYATEAERSMIADIFAEILAYSSRYPRALRVRRSINVGATSYVVSYFPGTPSPIA